MGLFRWGFVAVMIYCWGIPATVLASLQIIVKYRDGGTRGSQPPAWKVEWQQQYSIQTRQLFPHSPLAKMATVEVWHFPKAMDTVAILSQLRNTPEVLWAEINHVYRIHYNTSSDPLFNNQWYLHRIGAPQIWSKTAGSANIVVGVIDTGVDYLHEDLQGQLWVNTAEDLNANGRLDSLDLNGIDDDGNGYVDDVIGWDFTDAPAFADGGDYDQPDNDPMDEFFTGHGTPVAGLIAAANNGVGMIGVAPGIKIMALRAGTASGYLEEDDVAEAIVYAIDNGAKIINMSFGDVAFSYLLRDVIRYGVERGVIFVASAGNDGNDVFQYPAAYDETIAVGATDFQNNLAPFSSYGIKIDLVAPGVDLLSLKIGNNYGPVSGTSFSAPLVSGALALLWSLFPGATPDELKGMLTTGAVDLGTPGWDATFGHGLVFLPAAQENQQNGVATIDWPATNAGLARDTIAIMGTVFSAQFRDYSLAYGIGRHPATWYPIETQVERQVINDTLALWSVNTLPDTVYSLRLTLRQFWTADRVATVTFRIDHSAPRLIQFKTRPLLQRNNGGFLITIKSDDLTRVRLWPLTNGQRGNVYQSNYLTDAHYLFLPGDAAGNGYLRVELTNAAHLTTSIENDSIRLPLGKLPRAEIKNRLYPIQQWSTTGYLMPRYTDFDEDGMPEIVFSRQTDSTTFGHLVIAEKNGESWQPLLETDFPGIPRDAADVDGQPGQELLVGYGKLTYILGSNGNGVPRQVIWYDSSDFWGSRFVDVDGDHQPELLAIQNNQWRVFKARITDGLQFVPLYEITNPSEGNNQYGVPWCVVADFDGDTTPELVFGDYDGDVLLAQRQDNDHYGVVWWHRMEGRDATTLLQAGDLTGDGLPELIVATAAQPSVLLESNFAAQYWVLTVWQFTPPAGFQKIAQTAIQGVNKQRGIFNALQVVQFPGQPVTLLMAAYPDVYHFSLIDSTLVLEGFYPQMANTNTFLVGDWNNNQKGDVLFAGGDGFQLWEDNQPADGVFPPYQLTAKPLDEHRVSLSWRSDPSELYHIYRSINDSAFVFIDSTRQLTYLDTMVVAGTTYHYAVSRLVQLDSLVESVLSMPASAVPNKPPRVISISPQGTNQLQVQFSESLHNSSFQVEHFVMDGQRYPSSVSRGKNGQVAILGWDLAIPAGVHQLTISGIRDLQDTPLMGDTVTNFFYQPAETLSFYATQILEFSKKEIVVAFNQPVDVQKIHVDSSFSLTPRGNITAVFAGDTPEKVRLVLAGENRIGALGEPTYLTIQNVRSRTGISMKQPQTFPLVQEVTDLAAVKAYPNPVRPGDENELLFGNLPPGSEIFIYTVDGHLVRHLQETVKSGGMRWDLKSDDGRQVATGVYIYVARWNGQQKMGKILVIR